MSKEQPNKQHKPKTEMLQLPIRAAALEQSGDLEVSVQ